MNSKPDGPLNYAWVNANKSHVQELMPELANHMTCREWTGLMPFSKDGTPIVGKIKCLPGQVYIISGMSSSGMMQGPSLSRYLARIINGSESAEKEIRIMDPNRCINLKKMKP